MLDIAIAVLLSVVQAVAMILGNQITLNPPGPEHKKSLRVAFWATGVIGIGLTGILAYRGYVNSQEVIALLKAEPRLITSTSIVSFGPINDGTCGDQIVQLTGANTRDSVSIGWPRNFPKGVSGDGFVVSNGTIDIRACNLSGERVVLNAVPARVTVVR